jgi:hypothetical protein
MEAQASGVGGQELGSIPGIGGAGEQALEFFDTHAVRQEPPSCAWGQVEVEHSPDARGMDN